MERRWGKLYGIMAGIAFLILIFDSRLALAGAQSGIELCIRSVIPSLFPFFVLSMILTNSLTESTTWPLQVLAKRLNLSGTAISVMLPSVLGGYPVGAKCIGDLYYRKYLSRKEAEWLLGFCNNAGPSFLFGIISGFFPEKRMAWLLWFVHLFSAFLTAVVLPAPRIQNGGSTMQVETEKNVISSAVSAMIQVCCWVVLFRIIIAFLDAWFMWLLPVWGKVLLTGGIELTNGCFELLLIEDIKFRFVLCACMLAFGGICVSLQTASVINGLSIGCYLKGKVIQTAFSFLMSCTVILDQGIYIALIIPILVLILRKSQNRSGNPSLFPV